MLRQAAFQPNTNILVNTNACDQNNQNPINPKSVTIPVGGQISWRNNDTSYHQFKSLSNVFDTGPIAPGRTSNEVTFKNPETFNYFDDDCNILFGTINVVAANQPLPVNATSPQPVNATSPQPVNATSPQPVNATNPQPVNATNPQPVNATNPQPVNATNPQPLQQQEPAGFMTKGTINSLIFAPHTKWIATGNWSMNVNNGSLTSFETNMTWFNQNGTASHTHEFRDFKNAGGNIITIQQPSNNVILKGVMDVGTNHRIVWKNVPTTININGNKTITISVDDKDTNHHFAGQPVLGVVKSFTLCSDIPGPNMEILPSCHIRVKL